MRRYTKSYAENQLSKSDISLAEINWLNAQLAGFERKDTNVVSILGSSYYVHKEDYKDFLEIYSNRVCYGQDVACISEQPFGSTRLFVDIDMSVLEKDVPAFERAMGEVLCKCSDTLASIYKGSLHPSLTGDKHSTDAPTMINSLVGLVYSRKGQVQGDGDKKPGYRKLGYHIIWPCVCTLNKCAEAVVCILWDRVKKNATDFFRQYGLDLNNYIDPNNKGGIFDIAVYQGRPKLRMVGCLKYSRCPDKRCRVSGKENADRGNNAAPCTKCDHGYIVDLFSKYELSDLLLPPTHQDVCRRRISFEAIGMKGVDSVQEALLVLQRDMLSQVKLSSIHWPGNPLDPHRWKGTVEGKGGAYSYKRALEASKKPTNKRTRDMQLEDDGEGYSIIETIFGDICTAANKAICSIHPASGNVFTQGDFRKLQKRSDGGCVFVTESKACLKKAQHSDDFTHNGSTVSFVLDRRGEITPTCFSSKCKDIIAPLFSVTLSKAAQKALWTDADDVAGLDYMIPCGWDVLKGMTVVVVRSQRLNPVYIDCMSYSFALDHPIDECFGNLYVKT